MPIPLKRQKRVSLRRIAQHNSYYATQLIKSTREVARLTERIRELEKEKVRYREQTIKANNRAINAEKFAGKETRRADGILLFGMEEQTIKADIKKLQDARAGLQDRVVRLAEYIQQLKRTIRRIKKQEY
jgi:predicted  nucleic acid-binding Zn-ribbon protein